MMEGVPSLLIAAGLALLSPILWHGAARAARVGYVLLLVPGVIDLLILATVPPLLYPLEAAGLLLLAWAAPVPQGWARGVLVVMAALLLASMWSVFVTLEEWDAVDGYRIDGFVANVLVALGWVAVGAALLHQAKAGRQLDPRARFRSFSLVIAASGPVSPPWVVASRFGAPRGT